MIEMVPLEFISPKGFLSNFDAHARIITENPPGFPYRINSIDKARVL